MSSLNFEHSYTSHTSQTSSSSSPPYPISSGDLEKLDKTPPYPMKNLEEILTDDYDQSGYSFEVDSPSQRRTRAIIEESVTSTSPKWPEVPNLSTNVTTTTTTTKTDSPSTLYGSHRLDDTSQFNGDVSRTPTNPHFRHGHRQQRSSVNSLTHFADNEVYSRSPSPKRSIHSKNLSVSSGNDGYFANANSPPGSPRRPRSTYRVVSDNPFYDDSDSMDRHRDDFESPASEYFDYSILPELPVKEKEATRKALPPPPPPPPVPSALPPPIPEAIAMARKNQDLPPLPLELPQLPVCSASLQAHHFEACLKIWSLSELFKWCCKLQYWLIDSTFSKQELKKAIIRLLAFHRSDVPLDLITKGSQLIFDALLQAGAIEMMELHNANSKVDKSVVVFNEAAYVNGVLPVLTECYSPVRHLKDEEVLCYASSCKFSKSKNLERKMRSMEIKKIVLDNDWAAHWRLTIEDLRGLDPTLIKRQSLLFDLLRYEQTFIQRAKCFADVVCPEFVNAAKSFTSNSRIKAFDEEVLPAVQKIVQIHQEQLFEPLLKVLVAEGKFINSVIEIANIYCDWARDVRPYLVTYMNNMPMIEDLLAIARLKAFLDQKIGTLPEVRDLKVNVSILFISTFNSRYQQIPLQLLDIQKKYQKSEPEYFLLQQASDEIKKLGSKINDSKKTADSAHAMEQIKTELSWKSGFRQVNLNLDSANRKFICRGDLTRKSDLKITTQINHIVILDNYLLITERIKNSKSSSSSSSSSSGAQYRICEDPVPIDFLIFSEKIVSSSVSPIKLTSTSSSSHLKGTPSQTQSDEDNSIQYGIKIKYAGKPRHSNTFLCKTEREKDAWMGYISSAKTAMCKRLYSSPAYTIRSLSSTCFAYDFHNRVQKLQMLVPFDPIYAISSNALNMMKQMAIPADIYSAAAPRGRMTFSSIKCCVTFIYNDYKFTLVGLHNGLYCCESKSRWKKVMNGSDFSKIHVDTSTGLVIILSDRTLKYYLIHQIINVYTQTATELNGIPLSNDPVLFFSMANHKNVPMLFLAKKKGNLTNFKVMIPETDNNGVFSRFRDDRKFYIEAECYGISILNSSFAVHTDKGFEILELEHMIPRPVPELPDVESEPVPRKKIDQFVKTSGPSDNGNATTTTPNTIVRSIKKLLSSSHVIPLGMFKLSNNQEFLLVYDEFAIFVNKHGFLSRYVILLFDFKAKSINFKNNDLFLVKDDVLEILSISNFAKGSNKFIQVITGRDIRLVSSPESDDVTVAMANPLVPGLQLLFDLVPK
ncbi:uncharacterized protein LODBEIA_P25940 [Lodderomyces beijingensis]|uniref:Uncharacterized protein n=1 Tax=Lodderomyces beijingensis TaxID=1775926 RepID=A0ABP0ZQ90_9ASCO